MYVFGTVDQSDNLYGKNEDLTKMFADQKTMSYLLDD